MMKQGGEQLCPGKYSDRSASIEGEEDIGSREHHEPILPKLVQLLGVELDFSMWYVSLWACSGGGGFLH